MKANRSTCRQSWLIFIRYTAFVTAVSFTLTSTAGAAPAVLLNPEFFHPVKIQLPDITIPSDLGTIDEVSGDFSRESPVIVYIQDAHGQYSAQKSTQALLRHLQDNENIRWAFAEGAVGPLDPNRLRFFPHDDMNREIADGMAERGEVAGLELFLLEADRSYRAFGVEHLESYADNLNAFRRVIRAEPKTEPFIRILRAEIERFGNRLLNRPLREFVRSHETYRSGVTDTGLFLTTVENAAQSALNIPLSDPAQQLDWPELSRFSALKREGSELDKEALAGELDRLMGELHEAGVSEAQLSEFRQIFDVRNDNHLLFPQKQESKEMDPRFRRADRTVPLDQAADRRSNKRRGGDRSFVRPRHVLEAVYAAALEKGFRLVRYPLFSEYAKRIILQDEIDALRLGREIESISLKIRNALIEKEDERDVLALLDDVYILDLAARLSLENEKLAEFRSRKEELDPRVLAGRLGGIARQHGLLSHVIEKLERVGRKLDGYLAAIHYFYDGAEKRDEIIVRNVLARMKEQNIARAVLVSGGFHRDRIARLLAEAGSSYLVVTPNMNELDPTRENYYTAIMEGRCEPFRKSHIPNSYITQMPPRYDRISELTHGDMDHRARVLFDVLSDRAERNGWPSELILAMGKGPGGFIGRDDYDVRYDGRRPDGKPAGIRLVFQGKPVLFIPLTSISHEYLVTGSPSDKLPEDRAELPIPVESLSRRGFGAANILTPGEITFVSEFAALAKSSLIPALREGARTKFVDSGDGRYRLHITGAESTHQGANIYSLFEGARGSFGIEAAVSRQGGIQRLDAELPEGLGRVLEQTHRAFELDHERSRYAGAAYLLSGLESFLNQELAGVRFSDDMPVDEQIDLARRLSPGVQQFFQDKPWFEAVMPHLVRLPYGTGDEYVRNLVSERFTSFIHAFRPGGRTGIHDHDGLFGLVITITPGFVQITFETSDGRNLAAVGVNNEVILKPGEVENLHPLQVGSVHRDTIHQLLNVSDQVGLVVEIYPPREPKVFHVPVPKKGEPGKYVIELRRPDSMQKLGPGDEFVVDLSSLPGLRPTIDRHVFQRNGGHDDRVDEIIVDRLIENYDQNEALYKKALAELVTDLGKGEVQGHGVKIKKIGKSIFELTIFTYYTDESRIQHGSSIVQTLEELFRSANLTDEEIIYLNTYFTYTLERLAEYAGVPWPAYADSLREKSPDAFLKRRDIPYDDFVGFGSLETALIAQAANNWKWWTDPIVWNFAILPATIAVGALAARLIKIKSQAPVKPKAAKPPKVAAPKAPKVSLLTRVRLLPGAVKSVFTRKSKSEVTPPSAGNKKGFGTDESGARSVKPAGFGSRAALPKFARTEKKKIIYIVWDGLSDGIENALATLRGKTPLHAAKTPNLDRLTRRGAIGLMNPVRPGFAPQSDEAVWSMLGGSHDNYPGRGAIEVAGVPDMEVPPGAVLFRVNFASGRSVENNALELLDRRAGRNTTTEEARKLAAVINEKVDLTNIHPQARFKFIPTKDHRGALMLQVTGVHLSPMIQNNDPGYQRTDSLSSEAIPEGKFSYFVVPSTPLPSARTNEGAKLTAKLINEFIAQSFRVLKDAQTNRDRLARTVGALSDIGIKRDVDGLLENWVTEAEVKAGLLELEYRKKGKSQFIEPGRVETELDKFVTAYYPDKKEGEQFLTEFTGKLLETFVPPANVLVARDAGGVKKNVGTFEEQFGLKMAVLAQMPVEVGIAKLRGMPVVDIAATAARPTLPELQENYGIFVREALKALSKYDGAYVHLKGPDVPGHDGDAKGKVAIIEALDKFFLGPLLERLENIQDYVIVLTADRSTSVKQRSHVADPVPVLIVASDIKRDASQILTERSALHQVQQGKGLGEISSLDLIRGVVSLAGFEAFGGSAGEETTHSKSASGLPSVTGARALWAIDSRGNSTVRAQIPFSDGFKADGLVPSGASTGEREAVELRDGDFAKAVRAGERELTADMILKIFGKPLPLEAALKELETELEGKDTRVAVYFANHVLLPRLLEEVEKGNVSLTDQRGVDDFLKELERKAGGDTERKTFYGANAILAVSIAALKAGAHLRGLEPFEHIADTDYEQFGPVIIQANVLNGGVHGDNNVDIQETMVTAYKDSEAVAMRAMLPIFHTLKKLLKKAGLSTSVGDEGGFAPSVTGGNVEYPTFLEKSAQTVLKARSQESEWGKTMGISLDTAASELTLVTDDDEPILTDTGEHQYRLGGEVDQAGKPRLIQIAPGRVLGRIGQAKDKKGKLRDMVILTSSELVEYYLYLLRKSPVASIEDPVDQNDFEGYRALTEKANDPAFLATLPFDIQRERLDIVGDDSFVSQLRILKAAVEGGEISFGGKKLKFKPHTANAILVKINQVGTITDALDTIRWALEHGISVYISHRSGETEDAIIADIAKAVTHKGRFPRKLHPVSGLLPMVKLKTGSFSRTDRVAKFNRLIDIEDYIASKISGTLAASGFGAGRGDRGVRDRAHHRHEEKDSIQLPKEGTAEQVLAFAKRIGFSENLTTSINLGRIGNDRTDTIVKLEGLYQRRDNDSYFLEFHSRAGGELFIHIPDDRIFFRANQVFFKRVSNPAQVRRAYWNVSRGMVVKQSKGFGFKGVPARVMVYGQDFVVKGPQTGATPLVESETDYSIKTFLRRLLQAGLMRSFKSGNPVPLVQAAVGRLVQRYRAVGAVLVVGDLARDWQKRRLDNGKIFFNLGEVDNGKIFFNLGEVAFNGIQLLKLPLNVLQSFTERAKLAAEVLKDNRPLARLGIIGSGFGSFSHGGMLSGIGSAVNLFFQQQEMYIQQHAAEHAYSQPQAAGFGTARGGDRKAKERHHHQPERVLVQSAKDTGTPDEVLSFAREIGFPRELKRTIDLGQPHGTFFLTGLYQRRGGEFVLEYQSSDYSKYLYIGKSGDQILFVSTGRTTRRYSDDFTIHLKRVHPQNVERVMSLYFNAEAVMVVTRTGFGAARKPVIAANWKMEKKSRKEAIEALIAFADYLNRTEGAESAEVIIYASPAHLALLADALNALETSGQIKAGLIHLGAQDVHFMPKGAFTGDTSIDQLKDLGIQHVLIGHSERRRWTHEKVDHVRQNQPDREASNIINRKLVHVLDAELTPTHAVGETLFERLGALPDDVTQEQIDEILKQDITPGVEAALEKQLRAELKGTGKRLLSALLEGRYRVAYEPVWAIGTGKQATNKQANTAHKFIRDVLAEVFEEEFGDEVDAEDLASRVVIQYGGSVKPTTASGLLEEEEVDGALVGGASLKAVDFIPIIQAGMERAKRLAALDFKEDITRDADGGEGFGIETGEVSAIVEKTRRAAEKGFGASTTTRFDFNAPIDLKPIYADVPELAGSAYITPNGQLALTSSFRTSFLDAAGQIDKDRVRAAIAVARRAAGRFADKAYAQELTAFFLELLGVKRDVAKNHAVQSLILAPSITESILGETTTFLNERVFIAVDGSAVNDNELVQVEATLRTLERGSAVLKTGKSNLKFDTLLSRLYQEGVIHYRRFPGTANIAKLRNEIKNLGVAWNISAGRTVFIFNGVSNLIAGSDESVAEALGKIPLAVEFVPGEGEHVIVGAFAGLKKEVVKMLNASEGARQAAMALDSFMRPSTDGSYLVFDAAVWAEISVQMAAERLTGVAA